MKLAIADPPYLGRANRWYGTGRGHQGGHGRADEHPDAANWDQLDTHLELLRRLDAEYDGWAYAAAPDYERDLTPALPRDVQRMIWHRGNAIPSGARLRSTYEIVLVKIPPGRRGHGTGLAVDDVLHAGISVQRGFAGAKPDAWTRWVLAALGYQAGVDDVDDLFHGSGAVTATAHALIF
ncbi:MULTISPECIES: hypothetical protein [unclassified Leucobacter]|uniref:hypothetical protein n=1 Tax=unclassified Leucobacter TaxID=2621730 RepID=UPI003019D8B5